MEVLLEIILSHSFAAYYLGLNLTTIFLCDIKYITVIIYGFLEVDRIEDFDTVVVALKQLADLTDHAAFRDAVVKIENGNVTHFCVRNCPFSHRHASAASSCHPECPCSLC